MNSQSPHHTPQPQPSATAVSRRRLSIGIPTCLSRWERRFPLTPEGVRKLVERGYTVKIQRGAANRIHYGDNAYLRNGAEIVERRETLACDIVIHLAPMDPIDVRLMHRGAMLLTLSHYESVTPEIIRAMLDMAVVGVAIDRISDDNGHFPFADILAEIDGRAAISIASSMLADASHGKGILLGGVAGIVPCEVTIIGSGISAVAAARSASGLGAIVRMFDDDVYSLRTAIRDLGPQIIGSVIHERPLRSALHTADVVVVTPASLPPHLGSDYVDEMKGGVVVFDLRDPAGDLFESMPSVDIAIALENPGMKKDDRRLCYINAGNAVPRTAAMALSNTFNTLFDSILTCEGLTNALKLTAGLRRGVFTFLGKITDPRIAKIASSRFTDINIFLQLS